MVYATRWSDNERRFGPFLVSKAGGFKHTAIVINSGDDDEDRGCHFRISLRGHTLIISLPQVIKPCKVWVDLSKYEWASGPGYWDCHPREYGFTYSDNHLSVSLGRQTHDSLTEQRWSCFLPWGEWRFVRHSLYDLAGAHVWTEDGPKSATLGGITDYFKAKEACPSATFAFKDFDGEDIEATTVIEEREWKAGEGWFKWLSLFRKRKISRTLNIEFSKETGERKGSWKGGTLGHGINMLPGELHQAAFRRYCAEHNMTFIGSSPSPNPTEREVA